MNDWANERARKLAIETPNKRISMTKCCSAHLKAVQIHKIQSPQNNHQIIIIYIFFRALVRNVLSFLLSEVLEVRHCNAMQCIAMHCLNALALASRPCSCLHFLVLSFERLFFFSSLFASFSEQCVCFSLCFY